MAVVRDSERLTRWVIVGCMFTTDVDCRQMPFLKQRLRTDGLMHARLARLMALLGFRRDKPPSQREARNERFCSLFR